MSKIDKITKVFTKTITALVTEGDRLKSICELQNKVADVAYKEAKKSHEESVRAYKIAAKIKGVLN